MANPFLQSIADLRRGQTRPDVGGVSGGRARTGWLAMLFTPPAMRERDCAKNRADIGSNKTSFLDAMLDNVVAAAVTAEGAARDRIWKQHRSESCIKRLGDISKGIIFPH